jgi:hypothetical protein
MTGPDLSWIVACYYARSGARSTVLRQMKEVRDAYNGDVIIPLPEMDRNERATVANLVQQGMDQTADRLAGVLPTLWYPPVDPTKKSSLAKAEVRRKANLGWWEANNMSLKQRRRARWLLGYSTAPVMLRPDMDRQIPQWNVRDPLTTFSAPSNDPDDMVPLDCIFTYTRTVAWVAKTYPDKYASLLRYSDTDYSSLLTIIEYVDADVFVLAVLSSVGGHLSFDKGEAGRGRTDEWGAPALTTPIGSINATARANMSGQDTVVELERVPNRAGMCTVVVPQRITLDRPMGQFDGLIPLLHIQARMQALDVIATEKAIFPDAYLVGRAGETPKFVSGPHDGRSGLVNVVEGGIVEYKNNQPGPGTERTIDRLERNMRVSGGISPEFGGESATNIRTGKRGDSVRSEQIDHAIQAAQEIMAVSLQQENKIAVAIDKAYFGTLEKSFYVNWKGATGMVNYIPNRDFENDNNVVTFPYAGADANAISINLLQKQGAGVVSVQTVREQDPSISDAKMEERLVMSEMLDKALLASVTTAAQSGQMSPTDLTAIKKRLALGDSIEDAVDFAHKQAQTRQASSGDPGTAAGPVDPNSPEAQAGIAAPGAGAEQPSIAPPAAGQSNLASLLQTLRAPSAAQQGQPQQVRR